MAETFDLHTRLSAVLGECAQVLPFVADFAAFWQQPLQTGDGWSVAQVEAAERRLGLALPAALRAAYLLLGRRGDLTSNYDTLLRPDELHVVDGALVYRVENQGAACWGIRLADLEQDDPGTVMRLDLADKAQEHWVPWESGLTVACIEMVMSETVLFAGGFTDFLEADADEAGVVGQFRQLPVVGRDVRWFADPDVLIREVDGMCLHVRARTKRALEQLRDAVPGDWLNG
ncbi:SMI1/KNR4 family protein [Streptomyces sp. NPDC006733]|uniref:SMI1/KNR4 family protein n=1 Tax=Streptomyces sp. NPDC006733 TaxID=3155460 RepID=UPI0033D48672